MKRIIMSTVAVLGAMAFGQGYAAPAEDLVKQYSCNACHAVDKKLVGPSFKEVAAKYKKEDKAKLIAKIRKGGSGSFGTVPMPPNAAPSDADLDTLVTWVLSQK